MNSFLDFGIRLPAGASGEVKVICPRCSPERKKSKQPCLSVNVDEGVWNCWHCSLTGSLKTGWSDDPIQNERPRPKREPLQKLKWDPSSTNLPENVKEWFAKRKIPAWVLINNQVGYCKVWMPGKEGQVSAIAFPYLKNGQVVNVKYRDGEKNFRQEKDAEKCLYRHDAIAKAAKPGGTLIICEGEIDALSCSAVGFEAVTSIPDGAPSPNMQNYEKKFDYLESAESILESYQKIILAVDNDLPGQKLEQELVRRIGPEKCYKVEYPADCKDANDVLVKHGEQVLKDVVQKAQPYPVDGLFSISDVFNATLDLYEQGLRPGLSTGWAHLDHFYTVRTGEMTVITGIPGHGKSSWLDALMVNLHRNHGWSFAVCSPENWPIQRHVASIMEKVLLKPFDRNGFYTARMTREELIDGMNTLEGQFNFIMLTDEEMTVPAILSRAKTAILRHGVRGVILDPWNELDHHRPKELTEHEYISQSLTKLRRFARLHDVHLWVVAHPKKIQKKKDSDHYPVPTMYDISGSSTWYDKADNGIAIYRRYGEGLTDVCVQKVRFKEVGSIGKATLSYVRDTGTYVCVNA